MGTFLTILTRELKSYFYSPIAYVVLCFFLFLTGFDFCWAVFILNHGPSGATLVHTFFDSFFFWVTYILMMPLITMRSFSEEFKMGTIEALMTAPVRDWMVVAAKWAGCMIFYMVLWAPTMAYFWIFSRINGEMMARSPGGFAGGYLLLFLMGMFYCAVGCLASMLTKDQIIAAVISLVTILVLLFAGFLQYVMLDVSGPMREAFMYFSPIEQMSSFANGILDTRPIVWYVSMAFLMLVLAHHVFQTRKWKV